jgi:hypothetical protein
MALKKEYFVVRYSVAGTFKILISATMNDTKKNKNIGEEEMELRV